MNSRKTRLVLPVAVAAAIFGYKTLQQKPGADADRTPAGKEDATPVAPVNL